MVRGITGRAAARSIRLVEHRSKSDGSERSRCVGERWTNCWDDDVSTRSQLFQAYAKRFHESLRAGLVVEDVVKALADACKRAIEDEVPPSTKERKRKIAFYVACAAALDEAAAKIKAAA